MLSAMIFDMGNVLLKFDPELFLDRLHVSDPHDRELLLSAVFRSADWPLLDLGALTEEEMEERALRRIPPRLHDTAHRLIFAWDDPIEPMPGMASFVAECKACGLSIYLLSNASRRQKEYWPRVPGSEMFDGVMVSAFQHCVKPMGELYQRTLRAFHLQAEDCLFVDDMEENVAAAEREGIKGFLFTGDVDALRQTVKALGAALS